MINFLLISILLSMFFLFMNHPLSFGLILMIQTINISIITGMMNFNFWFSYILFLIMIGGMLILFMYMTSIASNEKFKYSFKFNILMLTFSIMTLLLIIYISTNNPMINLILNNYETKIFNLLINNNLTMSKFLNYPSNFTLYLIIMFLLITLIMVVKITNIQYGPLRQKF
nr:NADH dehydrogenase subunit 6 [Ulochaetes vacca]